MERRSSPLNKDYSHTDGRGPDGGLADNSPAGQRADSKKSRLERKRGRFRLNPLTQKIVEKTTLYTPLPEEPIVAEFSNQYYEKVEVTEDTINNPNYKPPKSAKKVSAIRDSGGKFIHYLIEYVDPDTKSFHWILNSETIDIERSGQLWLEPPDFEHDGINIRDSIEPPKADLDLSGIGPGLWKFLDPQRPYVELGVDIAEIRELPRMLRHAVTTLDSLKKLVQTLANPRGLSEWLLAIQFGWKPLVSDIVKGVKAFNKLDKRIEFLRKNSGLPIFRETPPWKPTITDEVLFEYSGPDNQGWMRDQFPIDWDPDSVPDRFKCKLVLHKEVTVRATGVMIYHLGDIPPTDAYLKLRLLGLIADESLMWEATRWTWLIDWFSNLGDVISNIRATIRDRLVSLYAYSQRGILREYTFTCSNGYYDLEVTRVFDTICREKIDPFGLSAEVSLSDLQLAILVALGITRS